NAANQSLRGAFVRVLHAPDLRLLWLLTALAVGILGISLAAAAGRRGDDARGFSLCAFTALLVSVRAHRPARLARVLVTPLGSRQPPAAFRAPPRRAASHLRRCLRAGRGARPGPRGLVGCSPRPRAAAAGGLRALLGCSRGASSRLTRRTRARSALTSEAMAKTWVLDTE